MTAWEDIDVPQGAFVGWGDAKGQHVTGKVLEYAERGGTDFNGGTCPLLTVELTEAAASFNKAGQRTDFPAGDLVNITCGQASLKRAVKAAALEAGDLVKITLEDFTKTQNGTVKVFGIKVARGAGGPVSAPATASAGFSGADEEPPF